MFVSLRVVSKWFFFQCFFFLLFSALLVCSKSAWSLPIGFGPYQGEQEFDEISSEHFTVYHNRKVPHEGAMTVNALEAMKPVIEDWLGITRHSRLPVVSSALSANASFANFLADSIELQTLGEGGRDLFWHEYVHTTMFEHFHNFFGPAGAVLHLPWVPAWFIEGLAEALTVSIGSDLVAAVERYQALTGRWPSYDKLHQLYGKGDFFVQGYATSGAFVSWILKRMARQGKQLPDFMRTLYRYTQPQYFFLSFNPFSHFMPMDTALTEFVGANGRELYAEYKAQALAHWQSHQKGPFLVQSPGERLLLNYLPPFVTQGSDAFLVFNDGKGSQVRKKLHFTGDSAWLTRTSPTNVVFPKSATSILHLDRPGLRLFVVGGMDAKTGQKNQNLALVKAATLQPLVPIQRKIYGLFETAKKIVWLERDFEVTRLCTLSKTALSNPLPLSRSEVACPLEARLPQSLELLGTSNKVFPAIGVQPQSSADVSLSTAIWLAVKEQTLVGDRYKIQRWDSATEQVQPIDYLGGGAPVQLVEAGEKLWLLVAEQNRRSLRHIDASGQCQGVFQLEDYPQQVGGLDDGSVILGLYHGSSVGVLKISPQNLQEKPCHPSSPHSSPLLLAMQAGSPIPLATALQQAQTWKAEASDLEQQKAAQTLAVAPGLDRAPPPLGKTAAVTPEQNRPAAWRPRPILAFPWIGADDPLGYQLGVISLPLMDEMQQENLRATVLVGMESHFPDTEIALQSTRFWPNLTMKVYKKQVWNGRCLLRSTQGIVSSTSYLDEQGVYPEVSFPWFFNSGELTLTFGLRAAMTEPLSDICYVPEGRINEPSVKVQGRYRWNPLSFSLELSSKFAPSQINPIYDYNVLAAEGITSARLPFFASQLIFGLKASRTRGKKTLLLKEYYQPLRTFVPGSGGGYNQNSFPLYGEGSLFAPRYGDSQVRMSSTWTLPLISNFEKQIWLFYMQSLNFSAYYNYGGAWYYGRQDLSAALVAAQGYKFDLLFENKGVNFNLSLGSGQVRGESVQVYAGFGFDAFF